jgi:hypothetical protein
MTPSDAPGRAIGRRETVGAVLALLMKDPDVPATPRFAALLPPTTTR